MLATATLVMSACLAAAPDAQPPAATQPAVPAALDFAMPRLGGGTTHLGRYYGEVVLAVNTASKCGLTPQYAQLQALHERYRDRGLRVLGFPANDFKNQEPGADEQIAAFCEQRFGVTFDLFSKIAVGGEDQAPLYRYLTTQTPEPLRGPISWNFEKFLISRDGEVVARFKPRVKPDSREVTHAIETALDAEPPADTEAVRALAAEQEAEADETSAD